MHKFEHGREILEISEIAEISEILLISREDHEKRPSQRQWRCISLAFLSSSGLMSSSQYLMFDGDTLLAISSENPKTLKILLEYTATFS